MTRTRLCSLALAAATATLWSAAPARADKFDGSWSMVAETTSGHCGVVAIGLAISRGRIQSTSGGFAGHPLQLTGRISGKGQAQMNAVAGPRVAKGDGQFGRFRGSGKWSGSGPSGLCSGVWTATRS
jgi:hypothetical protein